MQNDSTRRDFLATASCAAGATLLGAGHVWAQQSASNRDIGTQIYKSLKWNMVKFEGTTQEKFRVLRELGYNGVELDSPDGVDAADAIAAREATGLPIEGVVNSTHWKVRHSDPNPAVQKQALANMQTAMRYAKTVGAESVLLVPGKVTDPEQENHDQVWERSIGDIRRLVPLADELGILILIENVGNGFCESPELFAQYIDEIDSPHVGIHFDIGNHIRISPPADWIRLLGKRIKKLDVKDRTRSGERTLIGDGDADWPDVRKSLAELGYRGWAAAEVPGGDPDRLADVLRRMNNVLGKSDGRPRSLTSPC